MKRFAFSLVLLLLAGCAREATLDTTSMETVGKSIGAMGKRLSEDDQKKLAMDVTLKSIGSVMAQANSGNSKPDLTPALKDWHGLTAKEILAKSPAAAMPAMPDLPDFKAQEEATQKSLEQSEWWKDMQKRKAEREAKQAEK